MRLFAAEQRFFARHEPHVHGGAGNCVLSGSLSTSECVCGNRSDKLEFVGVWAHAVSESGMLVESDRVEFVTQPNSSSKSCFVSNGESCGKMICSILGRLTFVLHQKTQDLDVSSNLLERIPLRSIVGMPHLSKLNLSGNPLPTPLNFITAGVSPMDTLYFLR